MNCAISQAELNHDISQAQLEREGIAFALEQMTLVEDQAQSFLNNHTLTVRRMAIAFDCTNGKPLKKLRDITFGMRQVANVVMEKITPELCLGIRNGEPQAFSDIQKIVGDAAHEVAFDALDLESNPFLNYKELKETAEQANGY